jgi:hypothetical protein
VTVLLVAIAYNKVGFAVFKTRIERHASRLSISAVKLQVQLGILVKPHLNL